MPMEDFSAHLIRTLPDPTTSRLQLRSPWPGPALSKMARRFLSSQHRALRRDLTSASDAHSSWPVGGTRITRGCEYRYSLKAYYCSNDHSAAKPELLSALAAMYCLCLPWS